MDHQEQGQSKSNASASAAEANEKHLSSLVHKPNSGMLRSLAALKAIALNTFRETVRDRVLYAILVFALVATLAGLVFGSLSVDQDIRVLEDLGLFTITIFGGIISVFIGTNLVFKEIDRRTIFLIVTKPINRWEFVAGKFLGLALCIFVTNFAMGLFLIGITSFQMGSFDHAGPIMLALVFIYAEMLLVIAMATFFSTFATPLMSMVFTISLWICGHLSNSLLSLGKLSTQASVQIITQAIYYTIPDLASLTLLRSKLVDGGAVPSSLLGIIVIYIIAYCILLIAGASLIAERKEFN
jgi:Cu-processing system permease protein